MSDITRMVLEAGGWKPVPEERLQLGIPYLGFVAAESSGLVMRVNTEALDRPDEPEIAMFIAQLGGHLLEHGCLEPRPVKINGMVLAPYQPPTQMNTESRLYVPIYPRLPLVAKRYEGLGADLQFPLMSLVRLMLHDYYEQHPDEPVVVSVPDQYALLMQSAGRAMGRGTIVMERKHGEILGVRIAEAEQAGRDDEAEALIDIVGLVIRTLHRALPDEIFALLNDLSPDDSAHNLLVTSNSDDLLDPTIPPAICLIDQPHTSDWLDRARIRCIVDRPEHPVAT